MTGFRDLCVLFLLSTCLREAAAGRSGTTIGVSHDASIAVGGGGGGGREGGRGSTSVASGNAYPSRLVLKDQTLPLLREAYAYTPRWVANPEAPPPTVTSSSDLSPKRRLPPKVPPPLSLVNDNEDNKMSRRSEEGLWITNAELHVKLLHLVAPLRFSAEEIEGMTVQKERHGEDENEASRHSEHDDTRALYFSYWGRVYSPAPTNLSTSTSSSSVVWLHNYVPSPTINVMPGGLLNLTLVNDLFDDEEESLHSVSSDDKKDGESKENAGSVGGKPKRGEEKGEKDDVRLFNCAVESANTTNVHFHGMHVDPRIDDPFINIYPTTRHMAKDKDSKKGRQRHLLTPPPQSNRHRYELPIPASHVEGLHWYHAHRHGATYHHVMTGMFGAMTVLRLDSPPSLTNEKVNEDTREKEEEHILVFHFIRLRASDPARDARGYLTCTSKPLAEADEEIRSLVSTSPRAHWYTPHPHSKVITNNSVASSHFSSKKKSGQTDMGASATVHSFSSSSSSPPSPPPPSPPSLSSLKHAEHVRLPPTLYFVNGQHRPVLEVTESMPTKLRMVFAAGSCYLNMSFVPRRKEEGERGAGCVFVSEGVDGVPLHYASQPQSTTDEKKRNNNEERDSQQWLYFTTATRHEITLMCWPPTDEGKEESDDGRDDRDIVDVVHEGIVLMNLRVVRRRKSQINKKEINTVTNGGTVVVAGEKKEKEEEADKKGYSSRLTPSQLRYYLSASGSRNVPHRDEKSIITDNRPLTSPHYLDLTTTTTSSKGGKGMAAVPPNTSPAVATVFKWDVTFSQMPVTRSKTFVSSRKRPFYIIGSGANCTLAAESVVLDINSEKESYSVDESLTAASWSPEICAGASTATSSSPFNSSFSASHCRSRCDFVAFDGRRGDWWSHYHNQATISEKATSPPISKKKGGEKVKMLKEGEKEKGNKGEQQHHSKLHRKTSGTEEEGADASAATLHSLKKRYKDFVVPFDSIVELRIFGDPTDLTPHPFHAHVSHFTFISFTPRVVSSDSSSSPALPPPSPLTPADYGIYPGEWRDTIPILDGETVVQWRAATYDGEIVYHCHALTHEDRGMMTSYVVLPKSINVSGLLLSDEGAVDGSFETQEGTTNAYARAVKFFKGLLGYVNGNSRNESSFTSTTGRKATLLIGIVGGALAAVAVSFALYRRYKRNRILDLPGGNTRRRYVGVGSSRRSTNNWYSRGDDFEDDTNSNDVEEGGGGGVGSGGRMEELTPVAGALRAVATYEVPSYGTL